MLIVKSLIVFIFVLFLFVSCDLFDPRESEYPSNSGVNWQDPTSPDIVIENMQSALNGSSVLYMDCFDDSFVFLADTSDINEYVTYNFSNWDKLVENDTVNQLFAIVPADSIISSEFLIDISNPDPASPQDSATIYRNYTITVPSANHPFAAGIAEIKLIEDDEGFWSINEWADFRHEQSSFVTWAVMKAAYR